MLKLFRNSVVLLAVFILWQVWIHSRDARIIDQRATQVAAVEEVKIAILWPFTLTGRPPVYFREGVDLAIAEINANGGLRGKPLRAVYFDNRGDAVLNAELSRKISRDPSFHALVGSYFSGLALDTLVATQSKNLFYVMVGVETPTLTNYSFKHAVRPHFNTSDYIEALAKHLACREYKKLAIIQDQSEYSTGSSAELINAFKARGGEETTERIVPSWVNDFRQVLVDDKFEQADVIYLTVSFEQMPQLLKQIHEFGINADLYGNSGLIRSSTPEVLGLAGEGVKILSPLKSMANWSVAGEGPQGAQKLIPVEAKHTGVAAKFYSSFRQKYGEHPDLWAREGYDGILLFAEAVRKTGTLEASALFSYIRFQESWELAKGAIHFTENGDMAGETFYLMQVRDGAFILPEGDVPIHDCSLQ
ncbi:MAG: ABC transporter substrate-binding protein [Desulfuromonadaceae bacterium]|nr:ABC transporter substrate-binding protein [Desulfuromonadaceae bacterium]